MPNHFIMKVRLMKSKTIKVNNLARVEGEGALHIKIKNNDIIDVILSIFEAPRFFEAFLRGRNYKEVPDITARICGICPVAYQMSSSHALENAFGVQVNNQLRALRRLIYCGEWIESHALHVYMLHAPDFLGYEDAFQLAKDHQEIVERGLQLKKTGNELLTLLGGRDIHPINVCAGGFYKVPAKQDLDPITEKLKRARDAALETVKWTSTFQFPDFEQDYEFVSLHHPEEYPFNEGRLISNKGLDISVNEYDNHFIEEHMKHSNALYSRLKERDSYLTGPLARYNLNYSQLPRTVRDAASSAGLPSFCSNPFQSIIVRGIEILYACEEALRIIHQYEKPECPAVHIEPGEGTGYGCTEAPRGSLYHRYSTDKSGVVTDAKIVPPTSQNQKRIEKDLWQLIPKYINKSTKELTYRCEQAIRNYDPCISCATHFLKVYID